MEIIEYAIGFGGWAAVLSLLFLYTYGNVYPVTFVFTPIITICLTYIALQLCRWIFLVFLWIVELMFRAEIITTSLLVFTMGALVYTIRATIHIIHIEEID